MCLIIKIRFQCESSVFVPLVIFCVYSLGRGRKQFDSEDTERSDKLRK